MDHSYFFWQGMSYLELKNYSESEKYFKQDMQVETNGDTTKTAHFNLLFYTGVLYYEMHNYNTATSYLQQCLAQYPQHPLANYYLAMVYKQEKNDMLERKFLMAAQQSFNDGYGINEDNAYYTNFPHQVRMYEVSETLAALK